MGSIKTIDLVVEIVDDICERLPEGLKPYQFISAPTGVTFSIRDIKFILAIGPMMGVPEGMLGLALKREKHKSSGAVCHVVHMNKVYDFRDPEMVEKIISSILVLVDFETSRSSSFFSDVPSYDGVVFVIDEVRFM